MPKVSQETTNATTKLQLENLVNDLNELAHTVAENNRTYYIVFVSKEEFNLVRGIVFGFCSVILIAVAGAIIRGIVK